MGSDSSKKLRRLPLQPAGFPMGPHATYSALDVERGAVCHCGACSSGIKVGTAAKIGNKAAAQEASKEVKKGKK